MSCERKFETSAVRDSSEGKGDFSVLPWYGIWEVAKHCQNSQGRYPKWNVNNGIPLSSLLDSAARHLCQVMEGCDNEDHLRAAAWNILWALEQRTTHPELNDMPWANKVDLNALAKEMRENGKAYEPKNKEVSASDYILKYVADDD